jgi:hypothetical protein
LTAALVVWVEEPEELVAVPSEEPELEPSLFDAVGFVSRELGGLLGYG